MALTSHIEAGFERKLKTGTIFIDLTAAYNTVWKDGLMLKFLRVVSCSKISRLFNNMLSNRYFQVFLGDKSSRWRRLNNGLPQGSVFAPILFNLYMSDIPITVSKQFQYADDIALNFQHNAECETTLEADLDKLDEFFRRWRLQPNPSKTESCVFSRSKQTAALAIVYSTAEYCAPVWLNSVHTSKIDVQLNNAMRIISGCVKSTQLPWLPTLANIAPPILRRKAAAV
jgi:hypothetical protein